MATTKILELKKGTYYSAFLDKKTNNVYIGPKIPEEMGMAIIMTNNEKFGVFTFAAKDARSLVDKLGTPISHGAHGDGGYYKHYHLNKQNNILGKTHVWYFG